MAEADADHERRGRPSKDTPARRAVILGRLAQGTFLTVICREERIRDRDFPEPRTVDRWAEADPDFSSAIARAREAGGMALLAQALEIGDTGFTDYVTTPFGIQFNAASVQRSRLQAELRVQIAEKLAPRQLGKKVELSGDPARPLGAQKPLSDYSEAELVAAFEKARDRREGST